MDHTTSNCVNKRQLIARPLRSPAYRFSKACCLQDTDCIAHVAQSQVFVVWVRNRFRDTRLSGRALANAKFRFRGQACMAAGARASRIGSEPVTVARKTRIVAILAFIAKSQPSPAAIRTRTLLSSED